MRLTLNTEPGPPPRSTVSVEFCGEWCTVDPDRVFDVGRGADLNIDDNPFLHRHFLQVLSADGLWWLRNVGTRLPATVTDGDGRMQAWLAPGARLPLVFSMTSVIFTAGPTTYEFNIHLTEPPFIDAIPFVGDAGVTTVGPIALTAAQHLLILALAEPMLRREGTGISDLPTSVQAARRIGWAQTRFNRKLDNVCDKLDKAGVNGLRGGISAYATNRRARLVEYAVSARLVTKADLRLLDLALANDREADE